MFELNLRNVVLRFVRAGASLPLAVLMALVLATAAMGTGVFVWVRPVASAPYDHGYHYRPEVVALARSVIRAVRTEDRTALTWWAVREGYSWQEAGELADEILTVWGGHHLVFAADHGGLGGSSYDYMASITVSVRCQDGSTPWTDVLITRDLLGWRPQMSAFTNDLDDLTVDVCTGEV